MIEEFGKETHHDLESYWGMYDRAQKTKEFVKEYLKKSEIEG